MVIRYQSKKNGNRYEIFVNNPHLFEITDRKRSFVLIDMQSKRWAFSSEIRE